jgi:predicted RNase H-like HicB family nuclease
MNEIIFIVEDAQEGGFTARALSESIFTEADTMEDLRQQIRDAIACHFEDGKGPSIVRLHIVKEEVMAA